MVGKQFNNSSPQLQTKLIHTVLVTGKENQPLKTVDPDVASVLDYPTSRDTGIYESNFEIEREFKHSTPWQFLLKYVLNESGEFDLNIVNNKQVYKWCCVAANLLIQESGKLNVDSCKIKVKSNWNFESMQKQLANYHDKEVIELLKYGFPIECNTQGQGRVHPNHRGVQNNPQVIRKYIKKQLQAGTMIGPFKENPFGNRAIFSPMNTRDKHDSMDKRVIMDLSWPLNEGSVNSGINKSFYRGKEVKCTLPTVEDLVSIIVKKGRNCTVFRKDLEGAYKQMQVCLGGYSPLGI